MFSLYLSIFAMRVTNFKLDMEGGLGYLMHQDLYPNTHIP